MAFSSKTKEDMLVACNRRCCICHKYCGKKMECAHIEPDEGDDFDNGIPLCFDCHEEAFSYDPEHPKGNKFYPSELKRHRDEWYAKVVRYPTDELQPEYRKADIRSFMEIYRRLPRGWFLSHLDSLCTSATEQDNDHDQLWLYQYYIWRAHFQFFSIDVASAVADFNATFDRLMDVLALQHYVHPTNRHHYYRPYSDMLANYGPEEYNKTYSSDMNNICQACRDTNQYYVAMLETVGRVFPELLPYDPYPSDMIGPRAQQSRA